MPIDPDQMDKDADAELAAYREAELSDEENTLDTPTLTDDAADDVTDAIADIPTPAAGTDSATNSEAPAAPADSGAQHGWEERYKNLQAHSTRISQENSTLKRQLEQLNQRVDQLQNQTAEPFAHAAQGAQTEPDELERAAKDFEELEPFARRMNEQQRIIDELRMEREKQQQADYFGRISAVHPDHAQLYHSPEFQGWITRLTGVDRHGVEHAMTHGSPEDVIDVFTRYKQSAGLIGRSEQAAQLAEPTLRSRTQPQTKPRPRFTFAQINKMSAAEYAQQEQAIDEAIARGEVG